MNNEGNQSNSDVFFCWKLVELRVEEMEQMELSRSVCLQIWTDVPLIVDMSFEQSFQVLTNFSWESSIVENEHWIHH